MGYAKQNTPKQDHSAGLIALIGGAPNADNDIVQTYMTLMAARSQTLVVETMAKVLAGEAKPLPPSTLPSNQCYAPTLGQYLANGITRGVW